MTRLAQSWERAAWQREFALDEAAKQPHAKRQLPLVSGAGWEDRVYVDVTVAKGGSRIIGAPSGPAGEVAVAFGNAALTLDLTPPFRPVEMRLPSAGEMSLGEWSAVELLFGRKLAEWLRSARPGNRRTVEASTDGPSWKAVRRLAVGQMMLEWRRPRSQLYLLDEAFQASAIGLPAMDERAMAVARRTMPVIEALTRTLARTQPLDLQQEVRTELDERLKAIARLMASLDASTAETAASIEDLRSLLESGDDLAKEIDEVLAELTAQEGERAPVLSRAGSVPVESRDAGGVSGPRRLSLRWMANASEVGGRLAVDAEALMPDGVCEGHGTIPGDVRVSLPLRPATVDGFTSSQARVVTREGTELGRAPIGLLAGRGLPMAQAKIVIGALDDESLASVAEHGVWIDLATDAHANLNAEEIRRSAMDRARSSARRAIAAELSGDLERAGRERRQSAALFGFAGARTLQEQARSSSAAGSADWESLFLSAWQKAMSTNASESPGAQHGQLSVEGARQLVDDLAVILEVSPQLAKAHERLAAMLREGDTAEARKHLEQAACVYAQAGCGADAERVLRNP